MYSFFKKNPVFGIEITSGAVRIAGFSGNNRNGHVLSARSAALQPGIVSEAYGAANIHDRTSLLQLVEECLGDAPAGVKRRAGLSLPDPVFRVHTLEFDALPEKDRDRERLIRWRLEKNAAFDLSDTVLRYQVLKRQDAGFTVLSCVAKKLVISQYEALLLELGVEAWSVGVSSFFTLNFYAPYLAKQTDTYAFVHLAGDSFSTIMTEKGTVRFYRGKEVRRGGVESVSRLIREIDDSLHFYSHMDRSEPFELNHVFLSGNPATCGRVAQELSASTTLAVEVLSPEMVLASHLMPGPEMCGALGAGKAV